MLFGPIFFARLHGKLGEMTRVDVFKLISSKCKSRSLGRHLHFCCSPPSIVRVENCICQHSVNISSLYNGILLHFHACGEHFLNIFRTPAMPTVMGPPRPTYWISRGWSLRYTKLAEITRVSSSNCPGWSGNGWFQRISQAFITFQPSWKH